MSKTLIHKKTATKLKAHLAMAAFVVVTAAALTLTAVGLFDYATLDAGVQGDTIQANSLTHVTSVVAQASGAGS